jgi:S-formylglutathione hydrolase FrmB
MMWQRLAELVFLVGALIAAPAAAKSRVENDQIRSTSFDRSRIGVSPLRNIRIYLPPAYDAHAAKRFPVIFYLGSFFENETVPFDNVDADELFDQAIDRGVVPDFILVTADFSTPAGSSWYVNSPATGNWEDFLVRELVPHIDANYRTIPHRESRGLLGDTVGGYGALRIAMLHPELFGSVYAMQPVGTGASLQPTHSRPNFTLLASARSLDDLGQDHFSRIFTSIYQAFSANPERAPLYFDPPVRSVDGKLQVDSATLARFHAGFGLAGLVPRHADALKSLRAIKFDWGRADTIIDHIHGAQALSRQLAEYGVPHEAEEHSGGFRDRHWGEEGRVYTDVLPFFARHLSFGE